MQVCDSAKQTIMLIAKDAQKKLRHLILMVNYFFLRNFKYPVQSTVFLA